MLATRGWLGWLILAVVFWIIGALVTALLPVPGVVGYIFYILGALFFILFVVFLLMSLLGGNRDRHGGRGPLV